MVTTLQLHRKKPYPPGSGADRRVWETSKKFTEYGDTWVAAPWEGDSPPEETVTPLDIGTTLLTSKICRIYLWTIVTTAGIGALNEVFVRKSRNAVSRAGIDPDLVISECPQLSPAAAAIARKSDAAFLINKHNAEFRVVDQFLEGKPIPEFLCDRIVDNHRVFEQRMIDQADAVVFMSEEDCEPFDLSDTEYRIIPNGTDFSALEASDDARESLDVPGLDTSKQSCIFVGAYDYDPNRDAAERIVQEIAPACPNLQFLLVGRNPPSVDQSNVLTPGFVDDLGSWLAYADIALCPLTMGSGTKLKMLDYMAAGLPIVTTPVGSQGLEIVDGETALVRESTTEIVKSIEQLAASKELRTHLGENAQEFGKQYDWRNLFEGYDDLMDHIV